MIPRSAGWSGALALAVLACGTSAAAPSERHAAPSEVPAVAPPSEPPEPASTPPAAPTPPAPAPPPGRPGPWTESRVLANAAYDEPGAPSVIVHASPGFDPARPLRLVVFLHGYRGCARVLAGAGAPSCKDGGPPRPGWDLVGRFDEAATGALFVLPQLAFLRREGHPGRFAREGGFRAFVEELLAALDEPLGGADLGALERVTLLAHSAGFEAALAILARGQVEVHDVVLFDALYAGVEPFARWVEADPGRRLVSLHTGSGSPAAQNRRLARRLRSLGDALAVERAAPLPELVGTFRAVIARSPAAHGAVPARHIPELLPALGL